MGVADAEEVSDDGSVSLKPGQIMRILPRHNGVKMRPLNRGLGQAMEIW
jgi:hypothetical protein